MNRFTLATSLLATVNTTFIPALAQPDHGIAFTSAARVLFETGFEPFEGYSPDRDLSGQGGWISIGSGGNGILPPPIDGFQGQVAYVGFTPPTGSEDLLNVFRPVALTPVGPSLPVITFSVSFQIFDSTTDRPFFDDFRWSAYNTREERLFTLDFDNDALEINFVLDDQQGFRPSGWKYETGQPYDLVITLHFARNLWSAALNGTVIVHSQPITTRNAQLDLNEIDAVWAIRQPGKPGDNFMVFDDYRLTALPIEEIPPNLLFIGQLTSGPTILRVLGEPGVRYVVEHSSDLNLWTEVATGRASSPDGTLDVQDSTALRSDHRLYRARSLP
jgi:hypothetical protein